MTEPFDSFDEFPNPIVGKPEPKVVKEVKEEKEVKEVKEEKPATSTRGRRKKVEAPVDIPADVPAIED